MKNKSSFIISFLIIIYLINLNNFSFANEVEFKAKEILTFDEGNKIIGKKDGEVKINGEIEIFADNFTYFREEELIIAEGNVFAKDLLNEIEIKANKINYNQKKSEFISFGKTYFFVKKKYDIESSDVLFNLEKNIISSNKKTLVKDHLENIIQVSSFKYFDDKEILEGVNIFLTDNKENKYLLSEGMLNLKEYNLLGKDIKVLLRNDTFGVPDNEPKLKGNTVSYKNDLTIIKKGIFTSCKKIIIVLPGQ